MAFDTWVMYVLTVLAVCFTPGPNILLGMTHSIQFGLKRTCVTALGCISATSTMAVISATGLGAVLLASEQAFMILKWVGGAYLFYMGASLWFKKESRLKVDEASFSQKTSLLKLYRKGLFVSASNPKGIVFFGALFPVFLDPAQPLLGQFVVMLPTFLFFSYGSIMAYAAITSKIAPYLQKPKVARGFNLVTGSLFMGIGLTLATGERLK